MNNHITIIDAVRKTVEDAENRVQVDRITTTSDGNFKVNGAISRRSMRLVRTWTVTRDTLTVKEL